ncbi:MAG: anthranilate phosphoribosyltransferase [Rickettsiales bacterium]
MKSVFQEYIARLVERQPLSRQEASHMTQIILNDGASPAQIAAALVALRMKGETPDELAGAVDTLLAKSVPFRAPENAIDNCGTGGDGLEWLNVSTLAAFIVASCGVPVAKHGNRASSSRCGSADVLEELGVKIDASPSLQEKALDEIHICFLMAPLYHKAMYRVAPTRKDIGVRTLFNLAGPLANPANPSRQLVGVFSREWLRPMAEALKALGRKRALVVHSADGSDEISAFAKTYAAELTENGEIVDRVIDPALFGPTHAYPPTDMQGGSPRRNAEALHRALIGREKNAFSVAGALNAAAALTVAGKTRGLKEGYDMASAALESGKCVEILRRLKEITRE